MGKEGTRGHFGECAALALVVQLQTYCRPLDQRFKMSANYSPLTLLNGHAGSEPLVSWTMKGCLCVIDSSGPGILGCGRQHTPASKFLPLLVAVCGLPAPKPTSS